MEKRTGVSQPVAGGAASPRMGRGLETQLCTGLFPPNKFISGNDNNNMRTITGFGEKTCFVMRLWEVGEFSHRML